MHAAHSTLPGYDPEAILHDGCEECEDRANSGLDGLLYLDQSNVELLWRRVLNTEYGGAKSKEAEPAGRYRSQAESRLGHQLYLIGVFMDRHMGDDAWPNDAKRRVRPVWWAHLWDKEPQS